MSETGTKQVSRDWLGEMWEMSLQLKSIEEASEKFGQGKVDGFVTKLIESGFTVIEDQAGEEGWKIVNGRIAYVDFAGGAWAIPEGEEESWKGFNERRRQEGFVSIIQIVAAATGK
jgi:hypothetical protein